MASKKSGLGVRSCTRQEVMGSLPRRDDRALCETGNRLAEQFANLASRPERDKCDYLLRELHEARTVVARWRARLERGAA